MCYRKKVLREIENHKNSTRCSFLQHAAEILYFNDRVLLALLLNNRIKVQSSNDKNLSEALYRIALIEYARGNRKARGLINSEKGLAMVQWSAGMNSTRLSIAAI